jgi:biofilm protein TabA
MALFGPFTTVRAQAPQTAGFLTAFAYVDEILRGGSEAQARLRGIARGESKKIELAGGVFAIEQVYETKPRPEGFFESHRKYIDVQVIVEGEELMEVIDVARIRVRDAYNPERDLITYHDTDAASLVKVFAGDTTIFFPMDVHMPTLRVRTDFALVRKTVVKVPVA